MFCSIVAMAQNTDAMLFGDVKAKEGGKHLPHAVIRVKGTNLKTQCDATGHFKLSKSSTGQAGYHCHTGWLSATGKRGRHG